MPRPVKKIGKNRYQTKDAFNRMFNIDSTVTLKAGDDIEIQNGKFVKKTGKQPTPKVMEV